MKRAFFIITATTTVLSVVLFLSGVSPALADTVGYSSIGASTYSAGSASGNPNPAGLLITMPSAGSITKITAYVGMSVASRALTASIYTGSAGARGTLQATTNTATVSTSFGWVDFTFATPFSAAATTYWLQYSGYGGEGPGTPVGLINYDTGGAANTGYDLNDVGTPNYETNRYSMYATYTPAVAGPQVVIDRGGTIIIDRGGRININ